MKSKYIVTALLCMMLLFTSLPVSAVEISGNDANNGIMFLSDDYSINPLSGQYYPNVVYSGSVNKEVIISKFSDIINVDFKLFDIPFGSDSDFNDFCNTIDIYYENINPVISSNNTNAPFAKIIDYRFYLLINGEKYYFNNSWSSVMVSEFIQNYNSFVGCELSFSISSSDFDLYFDFNMSGTSTSNSSNTTSNYQYTGTIFTPYETHTKELKYDINVSWTNFEWNIFKNNRTNNSILFSIENLFNNLLSKLDWQYENIYTNLLNWFSGLYTRIENGFNSIITKMDEDQEEVINGYDPSTGDTADSDFNAGADELHNVESSLFQSAAYDEVDYSQYNDFFSLTGVAGAISFVSSFFESLYAALGIYAVPFTIGLVLIIITRILGYQNFSAGGG